MNKSNLVEGCEPQKNNDKFVASKHPLQAIEKISYPNQPVRNKLYLSGFEDYFNEMPRLHHNDPFLKQKVGFSGMIMKSLAGEISKHNVTSSELPAGDFERHILAMEEPIMTDNGWHEGSEFVLAKWGDGFTSPVHGHAAGYEFEEILMGRMLVNTYRMVSGTVNVVRPVETSIVGPGTFVDTYTHPGRYYFKRQALIHNFVSIGYSASLHYLAEHTRDGRDNGFTVQRFEDYYKLAYIDVDRITRDEAFTAEVGTVILVRSSNVPEYGDHYIVITGGPIMKPHGLRPQDRVISAPGTSELLDMYNNQELVLLKLNPRAQESFLNFHDIHVKENEVSFPDYTKMLQY